MAGQCDNYADFGTTVLTNATMFLAIYDLNGNIINARCLSAQNGTPYQTAVERNGSYCVAMQFDSQTISFGGTNVSRIGGPSNGLLTKWDANGNLQWFKHLAGGGYASLSGVSRAPNGDVLVIGGTRNVAGTFHGQTVNDAFVARLTADGNLVWLSNVATNLSLEGIATDHDGNAFISGLIGPGISQVSGISVTNNSPGWAPFVARVDAVGGVSWAMTDSPNTNTGNYGTAHSVAIDPTGSAYVCGLANMSLQFGSKSATNHGSFDLFLARLGSEPPALSILPSGANMILAWPTNQPGFVVERRDSLAGNWQPATAAVWRAGAKFVSTNAIIQPHEFFRLREE
jgi:hypothetical protein